ncbi:MAG: hypothetical protein U0T81_00900 [Saprospiraceae bacterium]
MIAGESYQTRLVSSDFTSATGYQFTLKFDQQALSFNGIDKGMLNIDESNFGLMRLNDGAEHYQLEL